MRLPPAEGLCEVRIARFVHQSARKSSDVRGNERALIPDISGNFLGTVSYLGAGTINQNNAGISVKSLPFAFHPLVYPA